MTDTRSPDPDRDPEGADAPLPGPAPTDDSTEADAGLTGGTGAAPGESTADPLGTEPVGGVDEPPAETEPT